jgi:amidophosphoribosyltransferase
MHSFGEKCALFAVYGKNLDVARLTYFGLFGLQHRGQESSGIAVSDGEKIAAHRDMGLVAQVFSESVIGRLQGRSAIGHNRYSTSKNSTVAHAQPLIVGNGRLAFAHNGNLPSTKALEAFLAGKVQNPEDMSDSRLMAEAINYYLTERLSLPDALKKAYPLFTGAFSLLAMTKDCLVAARDSFGIRPLSLAKLNGGFVFSSETCPFHTLGAEFMQDIRAGEMVIIDDAGLRFEQVVEGQEKLDIFEFIYFARHESHLMGKSVYQVRKRLGLQLAKETSSLPVDVVIGVPESGIPPAIGYAQARELPYDIGLAKNRYIGRTFIAPDQKLRDQGVKMKLTTIPEVIKNKRVAVVDDSIVRGTTSKKIIEMLFEAGATEVHFLVASAPIRYPDFYGIDISRQEDLIAYGRSEDEVCQYLGATSVHYLSLEGMLSATGLPKENFNTSCFTGTYPIDLNERSAEFTGKEAE